MVGIVRIDGDGDIAAGDALLADGQGRILCVGEDADVGGGGDAVPAAA
jgi:hypothetical protein